MDIDTMPAGPKLDALVAEKVMVWKRWNEIAGVPFWADDKGAHRDVWCPSTDIAAAWEVWEQFKDKADDNLWWSFVFAFDPDPGSNPLAFMRVLSPLLICRAALKAVGVSST